MEVAEVPIGTEQRGMKKFSSKVRKQTDEYLAERGINIEQLTNEQQKQVLKFTKTKRAMKWLLPVGLLCVLAMVLLGFEGWRAFIRLASTLEPDSISVETNNGTTKYVMLSEEDSEAIQGYGIMCAVGGGVLAAMGYTAISVLITVIGQIFTMRETGKMLDAFLPAI